MQNVYETRIIKYFKSEDIIKSSFTSVIQIRKSILISEALLYFTTVVGKVKYLVVGIIGVIFLQKSGQKNRILK